jgi:hypothetical protein
MIVKNKYIPVAFFVFGLICAIFGFVTQADGRELFIPSAFYLELAIFAVLAALYLEMARKN